jgi:hypothetical protein
MSETTVNSYKKQTVAGSDDPQMRSPLPADTQSFLFYISLPTTHATGYPSGPLAVCALFGGTSTKGVRFIAGAFPAASWTLQIALTTTSLASWHWFSP